MNLPTRHNPNNGNLLKAFSLVEMTIATAIVGVMLVAALNTVGAAKMTQQRMGDQSLGSILAQDLMAEIMRQAYEDPDAGPGSFGLGGDEVGDGSRALWEDVDDYYNWSASPPQQKDGTEMSDLADWGRSVEVVWIDPTDLSQEVFSNQGAKRITVTVTCNDTLTVSLVAVRTTTDVAIGFVDAGGGKKGL